MGIQIAVVFLLVVVALLRHRLSYAFRAAFLLACIYLVGTAGSLTFGNVGNAALYLFAFGIMCGFFFGTRAGFAGITFAILTQSAIAVAGRHGFLHFADFSAFMGTPAFLANAALPFVVGGVVAIVAHKEFLREMLDEIQKAQGESVARKESERKNVELIESLSLTQELAAIGGWRIDVPTGKTHWDRGLYLIHDLDPLDQAGAEVYRAQLEANLSPEIVDARNATIQAGKAYSIDNQRVTAKGRTIWIQSRGTPLIQDGKTVAVIGLTQDITARKLAELERSRLLESLRLTEEYAHVGGWYQDVETKEGYYTPGAYRILDLDPSDQAAFEKYRHQLLADRTPEHVAALETCANFGTPFELDVPRVTAKGRKIWVNTSGHAIVVDGKVVAIAGDIQDITARKTAEIQNQELIESLSRTEDAALIGTWEQDLETGTTTWSPSLYKIHDLDPSDQDGMETTARELREILDPNIVRLLDRAIENQTPWDIEHAATTITGRCIWLHSRGSHVVRDGKSIRLRGHSQDITARKTAEQERLHLLEDLQRTEEIAGVGGWHMDVASRKLTWTRGCYLIHDIEPSDEVGLENYRPELLASRTPEHAAAADVTMSTGVPFDIEAPRVTAKGRNIWIHTRGEPVVRDGKIVAIAGHIQDISARKLAELKNQELIESLTRTEAISKTGGWALDLKTGKVSYTAGSYLIHELDPSDIEGFENYTKAAADPSNIEIPALAAAMTAGITDGKPFDLETPFKTAKGRSIWLHTRGEAVIHDGRIERMVGFVRDITARKEAEEQLRASQKMEAVGQLTAGIAHDFNNLLAVVSANLELLEEEVEATPKQTKRVKAALKAVDRGAELTQHLLAFGRNQALSPKRLNLCNVVEHSVKLMQRTLPGNIAVQVMADPEASILANVDEGQLENALLNLALNARDAMPDGGTMLFSLGTRDVGAGKDERRKSVPPGRYGVITVQDTGKGMSAEVMAKVFDPFFTTKPVGQGTGLGLSMVYGFVRQSGGRVQLTSTEGKGTTFTLLFPLVDEADNNATPGQSPQSIKLLTVPRRVLLVEDMPDVLESILAQLESLGLEVTAAEDATAALALLSSGQAFDLMFTDLGLPGAMGGDDLVAIAAEKSPGMKIITMTGYNKDRVTQASKNLPTANPHLRKPFKRAELQALLISLFEK